VRTSEVAAQAHVNAQTLRHYELAGMRDALARLIETCGESRAERQCPILHDIETAVGTR
jgi:MerR family transcriptional regulator, mercuric resistance operon regulatory protein